MDPILLKKHLLSLCEDMDAGRPLRRSTTLFAGAALLGASLGLQACGEEDNGVLLYGVPDTASAYEDDCTNELDDDNDGLIDCDDEDCAEDAACSTLLYAAPEAR